MGNWDKKSKEEKTGIIARLIGIAVVIVITVYIAYQHVRGHTSKGKLARKYNVSVKVLMNWLKLFGSEQAKQLYLGNTDTTVSKKHFCNCLGEPEDYQEDKDGFIYTKPQISKVCFVSERTLLRRISNIENPEEEIGMSHEVYRSIKYFPPKHANMIVEYLKNEQT